MLSITLTRVVCGTATLRRSLNGRAAAQSISVVLRATRRQEERRAPQRPKGDVQDRVYAELRRWLMVGRFLPGEPITLRNLASELGVSPMPVRAACAI